jgi:hypothetical protein
MTTIPEELSGHIVCLVVRRQPLAGETLGGVLERPLLGGDRG